MKKVKLLEIKANCCQGDKHQTIGSEAKVGHKEKTYRVFCLWAAAGANHTLTSSLAAGQKRLW